MADAKHAQGLTVAEAHEMAARAAANGIRMTFSTAAPRKQPKAGDRRATKKHGEQVRVHARSNGMLMVANGRYVYEWVSADDARAARYAKPTTAQQEGSAS
jgi:hypothetical protein